MAVEVWHVGCAYSTPKGDALCTGIISTGEAMMIRAGVDDPSDEQTLPPGTTFNLKLDDPNVQEVLCFLK